jgi:hypothetical protein
MKELLMRQDQLKRITMTWAAHRRLDEVEAHAIRRSAIELCHEHYLDAIPMYRKVCRRMGVDGAASFDTIAEELLVPDDIFKSYPARLLDEGRFGEMNEWISSISSERIEFDTSEIETIDDWIERVDHAGLKLVFSSGTSGHISFVPRDPRTWRAFTELPFLYAAAQIGHRGLLPAWKFFLVRAAADRLAPDTYSELVKKHGLRSLDAFIFNFSGGNQGIQLVGQELGKLTRSAQYLYRRKMSASAVRCIVRGPRNERERALAQELLETTVHQKQENYRRVIDQLELAAKQRRRVVLFGTPALMLELCEEVARHGGNLALPQGSSISYGGGWKSFTGKRIPEDELNLRLAHTFALPRAAISEGYSMTEINGLMQKCLQGRFHVPPFLEAAVYDEELNLLKGDDVRGTLGVLDPFASSYPGFVLTGDNVRLMRSPCACGLPGPTILRVERSPGKEVKGCGGIMATVNA